MDRRAVRSSSRRITPTPQPSSRHAPPAATRPAHRNAKRAAGGRGHEAESFAVPQPTTRTTRKARQPSVESVGSEGSRPAQATRRTARDTTVGDLTTVEEDEGSHQPNIADRASLGLAPRGTPRGQKTSTGSGQRSERKRSRPSFDPKKSLHPEAISFLGTRPKRPTGQAPSEIPIEIEVQREEPREHTHNDEDDTWQPAPNDDDDYGEERREETPAASTPSSSARTLSRIRRQEKNEPENRRRFIDPQPNPERVEWQDGFDQSQSAQRTNRKGKSSQGVSKRRFEVEEESSEDDDFEQGTSEQRRQVPKAKRARFAATSPAPPSHQPRATQQDEDYSLSVRDSTPEDSEETVARAPSSSAPQYTQYSEVKALARKHVSQRAKLNNQARRARNPWSVEACQALIDYIGDIGCSWKDIKRHDEAAGYKLLDDRTQVDLKDKARNLKVEFLKAGCGLPPGFEEVSLGLRIENQLRNQGVKI